MIYYTDNTFDKYVYNPYNKLPYDNEWVLLKLIDKADFSSYTGNGGGGIFRFIVTKEQENWQYSIMDFIGYESQLEKNIIVAVNSDDLGAAEIIYSGHNFKDNFLRDYEAPVLVHTTTPQAFKKIISCGFLKSWNYLNRSDKNISEPIGKLLGDPEDYSDYIMFNSGGYFSELVVSAKQKNCIDMDINAPYLPGARLYFDAKKIANDGLLVRDGAHLKVKDKLEIEKYMLWIATPETIYLPEITTPYEFGTKSDQAFEEKFNINLN